MLEKAPDYNMDNNPLYEMRILSLSNETHSHNQQTAALDHVYETIDKVHNPGKKSDVNRLYNCNC